MSQLFGANTVRVSLVCFLTYFILSGMLSQLGTLLSPIATHFDKSLTEVGSFFTFLSAGISVGTFLSLVVFEWASLRKTFLLCYSVAACSLLSMLLVDFWAWLPFGFFLAGAASGLGLAAAAVTLSLLYQQRRRAAALLATDVCFAAAGMLLSPLAAWLIGRGLSWNTSFALLAALCVVILVLAIFSTFPQTARETQHQHPQAPWPKAIYFLGAGIGLYLLGQVSLLMWLPHYLQTLFSVELNEGATSVSRYWMGMALGQIALILLVSFCAQRTLLFIIVCASAFASAAIWLLDSASAVILVSLAFGLINAGILKLTIASAASLVAHPQRAISTLLCCGSVGQAVAPWVSASITDISGVHTTLVFMSLCYLAAALSVVVGLVFFDQSKVRAHAVNSTH